VNVCSAAPCVSDASCTSVNNSDESVSATRDGDALGEDLGNNLEAGDGELNFSVFGGITSFFDAPSDRGMDGKAVDELVRTDVHELTGGFSSSLSPGLGESGTVDRVAFVYGTGVVRFGVDDDSTCLCIGDRSRMPNKETSVSSLVFWFLLGLDAKGL
jgi:hypothetical protein